MSISNTLMSINELCLDFIPEQSSRQYSIHYLHYKGIHYSIVYICNLIVLRFPDTIAKQLHHL